MGKKRKKEGGSYLRPIFSIDKVDNFNDPEQSVGVVRVFEKTKTII